MIVEKDNLWVVCRILQSIQDYPNDAKSRQFQHAGVNLGNNKRVPHLVSRLVKYDLIQEIPTTPKRSRYCLTSSGKSLLRNLIHCFAVVEGKELLAKVYG